MNKVEWAKKAVKQLRKLPQGAQRKLYVAGESLANWPRAENILKLADRDEWRLRHGNYRLFFRVLPTGEITIIRITEVRKRNERTYQ
ncbi:MAG: type II toxin-antitoxin system RelE/ParE family toxin [Deltaproteobacteria bacterium]|jgi:mRNA-degrading endonuclease RelE of RelBE toxin-antitoxin system|nr:type II toxin-antitoxin system RelE/ParE family toxin [Deltaproteobacteria bacterium]